MTVRHTPKEEREDAEANYFAMCLLMPEKLVHKECDKLLAAGMWDENGVRMLARKFAVSDVVMSIRLMQLKRMSLP